MQYRRKKFTFAISSPDEFLYYYHYYYYYYYHTENEYYSVWHFSLGVRIRSNTDYSTIGSCTLNWCFSAIINSSVLTVHKTIVTDWLTYVENILQPTFVGPFNIIGPSICLQWLCHNPANTWGREIPKDVCAYWDCTQIAYATSGYNIRYDHALMMCETVTCLAGAIPVQLSRPLSR